MSDINHTMTPVSPCPWCGHKLDCATALEKGAKPRRGDITLCIQCGKLMVFKKDLTVRKPTSDEAALFLKDPNVTLAQIAWASMPNKAKENKAESQ